MSKYIIDVGDAYTKHICGKGDMLCLPVRINEFEDNWVNTNIPLTSYTEPDMEKVRKEAYDKGYMDAYVKSHMETRGSYQQGLNDAWEAVKKIALMDTETSENVTGYFGLFCIMENLTPMQVIEKIRQYEQKQEQIQVGDEVISEDDIKAVVIDMDDYLLHVLDENGVVQGWPREDVAETGRHFPELAAVLEKMKEE